MHIITKLFIDGETTEYLLDGHHLITANHDTDGWTGMERINDVIQSIADRLEIKVIADAGDDTQEDDNHA